MQLIRLPILVVVVLASYSGLAAYSHSYFESLLPEWARIDPEVERKKLEDAERKKKLDDEEIARKAADTKRLDDQAKKDAEDRKRKEDAARLEAEIGREVARKKEEEQKRLDAEKKRLADEERKKKEEEDARRRNRPPLKGKLLVLAIPTRELSLPDDKLKKELLDIKSKIKDHLLGQEFYLAGRGAAEPQPWDPAKPIPTPAEERSPTVMLNEAMQGIETLAKRAEPGSADFRVFVLLKSHVRPLDLPTEDRVDVPLPEKRWINLVWLGNYARPKEDGFPRMSIWFHDNLYGLGPNLEPGDLMGCIQQFVPRE